MRGAIVCLLPLVHLQLGVFQVIALGGIIWTILALERFRRCPGPFQAVHWAAAFACTDSLCCYYGLFLSILLLICAPLLFGRRLLQKRTWWWGLAALACTMLLLLPIVWAQLTHNRQHSFKYPEEWVAALSVLPTDPPCVNHRG